jgi:hypothetical protein
MALLKNVNFDTLEKLVVLTSLFRLDAIIRQTYVAICKKKICFLCFVQQCPQRVVLAAIFSPSRASVHVGLIGLYQFS